MPKLINFLLIFAASFGPLGLAIAALIPQSPEQLLLTLMALQATGLSSFLGVYCGE